MVCDAKSTGAPVFTMSLLVTGNLLGAGILALPINFGPAGLLPSLFGIVLVWALMLFSANVLAGQPDLACGETGGLPSFFGNKLGRGAKWLAVAADLVIFYGVLTAYLTGTTTILVNLFHLPIGRTAVTLCYFAVAAGLASFGMGLLRRCNAAILLGMALTFLTLVVMLAGHVDMSRAGHMRPWFLPAALPVALTAFLFHNLIPTLCREMRGDVAAMRRAILYGSLIGLAMNLIWMVAVFCSLPMEGPPDTSILGAFDRNLPATVPLSILLGSRTFQDVGLIFAILAMTAAFLANGVALRGFLIDLMDSGFGLRNRAVIWILAFMPPLVVSVLYPDIFLVVMNLVGGVGICLLFGILPALLARRQATGGRRILAVAVFCLFGLILCFEAFQEFGLTHIHPDTEYWHRFMD